MKKEKKEITEKEALLKLTFLCSTSEYCLYDIKRKLSNWNVPDEKWPSILTYLQDEKYVDENRFAAAFVKDKWRYNGWGKRKIVQALRLKQIATTIIDQATTLITDDDYEAELKDLLLKKSASIKAKNNYEHRNKLIRFALSRGYQMDEILRCLPKGMEDEEW